MRLIAITQEELWQQEAQVINNLFDTGLPTLHLRKPTVSEDQTKHLIDQIDPSYYSHIVLHDYHHLALEYGLGGVHLSGRCRELSGLLDGFGGTVSRSCHSIAELTQHKAVDYQFLSPIYNSISKSCYPAAFEPQELSEACSRGLIHSAVIALGGIEPSHISQLRSYHFGGVAVLGYLWADRERQTVINNLKKMLYAIG